MWGYPFDSMWPFEKYHDKMRKALEINTACVYWNQTYPGPDDVVIRLRNYYDCGTGPAARKRISLEEYNPKGQSFVDPPYEFVHALNPLCSQKNGDLEAMVYDLLQLLQRPARWAVQLAANSGLGLQ